MKWLGLVLLFGCGLSQEDLRSRREVEALRFETQALRAELNSLGRAVAYKGDVDNVNDKADILACHFGFFGPGVCVNGRPVFQD